MHRLFLFNAHQDALLGWDDCYVHNYTFLFNAQAFCLFNAHQDASHEITRLKCTITPSYLMHTTNISHTTPHTQSR